MIGFSGLHVVTERFRTCFPRKSAKSELFQQLASLVAQQAQQLSSQDADLTMIRGLIIPTMDDNGLFHLISHEWVTIK